MPGKGELIWLWNFGSQKVSATCYKTNTPYAISLNVEIQGTILFPICTFEDKSEHLKSYNRRIIFMKLSKCRNL